jgi:integrase
VCPSWLIIAGLRAEELGALRWSDVDLANGRICVGRSKTSARVREVDMLPLLREELADHKSAAQAIGPDDPVFVQLGRQAARPA